MTSHVTAAERRSVFKKLLANPENRVCFDCPQKKPMWASSTFGVFICLDCAGGQRRLGTHLTFVRSVDMDEWTVEQLEAMKVGGNGKARAYFRENGMRDLHQRQDFKYKSVTAKTYKNKLAREVQQSLSTKRATRPAEAAARERERSIDEDGEKGLDKLMTSLQAPLDKAETPTRATSAPELTTIAPPAAAPADEDDDEEDVPQEPPKAAQPVVPKGTLSAGMLLGPQSGKLPTSSSTSSLGGSSKLSASRRKPTSGARRAIGARRLDDSTVIDFTEPPRPTAEPPKPTSSRIAAAYEESAANGRPANSRPANGAAPTLNNGSTNGKAKPPPPPAKHENGKHENGDTAITRFGAAKGFGSDAYFGLEDDKPKAPAPPSAARFAGSSGIGSDAFFNDDHSDSNLASRASGLLASTIDRFR
mmetsp:Transcript_9446/g.30166  ORF Transcript_9446/g.30166 Transcript_9446/m.30166 type:complete len:419 (+) Transcript_9446:120-1376(+)